MGKNYFIADLHFGHSKIIPICNRPFSSLEDMHEKLINNWNNKVSNEDTVYILGDVCFKMSKTDIIKILKQLKGRKVLLKGNHDRYVGQRDFDECFDGIYDIFQITEEKQQIVLCHYPIIDFPGMYYGAKMIYGHIHDKYVPHKNMYCASVECIGFAPVTLEELEEIYKDRVIREEIDWTYSW